MKKKSEVWTIKEERTCARDECENTFTPAVHNQRFCCKDCCKVHTNKRILAQYHERKNKKGKRRVCGLKGCETVLSRYNEGKFCSIHEGQQYLNNLKRWGWLNEEGQ